MDARGREQILSVIAHVLGRLGDTRGEVASARKKLDEGWGDGIVYWDKVREKLARDRSTAPHYKELDAALQEIDLAVAKAQSACEKLTRVTFALNERK